MIVPTNIGNIGVSLIKKNNKVSLSLAEIDNKTNKVQKLLNSADSQFPFNNPLITKDAVQVFEFLIEAKNFAQRNFNNKNI